MAALTLYYPPSLNGLQKSLASALDAGTTASATLNNTTSIQNKPGVCVVDRIDSSGALKSTSVREYISYAGTSGATLTTLVRNVDNSSSDQDHAIGAVVEFIPDVTWAQAVIDALAGVKTGVVLDTPAITTPKITTSINDSGGNEVIKTPATASAVNEITVTNAATGNAPIISATGGDTNIDLSLAGKGTGKVKVNASYGDLTADSDASTITFNCATSNKHTVTLGDNRTLALSNDSVGQVILIDLVQDGTGSRTVTWFSGIKWAGGSAPTLTTTASKADTLGIRVITAGSAYYGYVVGTNL